MELIFAAKTLSSMSFLFFLASYISLVFKMQPGLFPAFMLICAGMFLCFIFDIKLKPKARFIPLIAVFASAVWIKDIPSGLIIAVGILYATLMIARQAYFLTYGEGADEFKRNIKIILFLLFTSIVFGIVNQLGTSVLPFAIIYLISSVCELSMLRHSDETLKERRFRLLNSAVLLMSCLLGFFMATSFFMKMCSAVLKFIALYIFSPIMMAITTVSSYILLGFANLLSDSVFELMKTKGGKGITFENLSGLVDDNKFTGERSFLDVLLYIFMALIIIAVLVALFKKLMKGRSVREVNRGGETRFKEYIPRKDYGEGQSNEVKGIRNIYRKFLILLENKGLSIPIFYTTADVNSHITDEIADKKPAEELREYYLLARYGEKELSKADLQRAKQLYSDIKKNK